MLCDEFSAKTSRQMNKNQILNEKKKKVLEERQRTLGSEHPDTLWAMTELASGGEDIRRKAEDARKGAP